MHRHQLTTFDQLRIAVRLVDLDCEDEPALAQDIVRVDDARLLFVLGNEASWIQSGLEQLRVVVRDLDEFTGVDAVQPDLRHPGIVPGVFLKQEAAQTIDRDVVEHAPGRVGQQDLDSAAPLRM